MQVYVCEEKKIGDKINVFMLFDILNLFEFG